MNVQRINFGKFVIFINVFSGNAGANFTHHHDDLLSYVLYDSGREILIDPGMPNFLRPNEFSLNYRHNGIWCEEGLLRPMARFFTPRSFFSDAIKLNILWDGLSFSASAQNIYTGDERVLHITGDYSKIQVIETYRRTFGLSSFGFTHCFADDVLNHHSPNKIKFAGLEFSYDRKVSVAMRCDRALAYGEPGVAHLISAKMVDGQFSWKMCRAV